MHGNVFRTGSVIMINGMLVLLFKVKEPDSRLAAVAEYNQAVDAEAKAKAEAEKK